MMVVLSGIMVSAHERITMVEAIEKITLDLGADMSSAHILFRHQDGGTTCEITGHFPKGSLTVESQSLGDNDAAFTEASHLFQSKVQKTCRPALRLVVNES